MGLRDRFNSTSKRPVVSTGENKHGGVATKDKASLVMCFPVTGMPGMSSVDHDREAPRQSMPVEYPYRWQLFLLLMMRKEATCSPWVNFERAVLDSGVMTSVGKSLEGPRWSAGDAG